MTLEQVAERAGMSANYVGAMENDKHTPGLTDVLNVARALGVQPGELFPDDVPNLTPAGQEMSRMLEGGRPLPTDDPPSGLAAACRVPTLFEIPFIPLDTRQQVAPWRRPGT